MAGQDGSKPNGRKKSKRLTYFFLNGDLHKSLHINRGADTVTTWCYPQHKRVAYTYSDVKKNHHRAFTTAEVCAMINRSRTRVEKAILDGNIEEPQYTYGLTEVKQKFQYMWDEKNILDAHRYFSTVHVGRPRNDGRTTPKRLPTVRELRAMIRQEKILYVENDDGEFVPVWRAAEFD